MNNGFNRTEIAALREKLLSLYSIFKKQDKLVKGIETGVYTYSQKPIKIPDQDKPQQIAKEEFSILFKLLEEQGNAAPSKVASVSSMAVLKQSGVIRPTTTKSGVSP